MFCFWLPLRKAHFVDPMLLSRPSKLLKTSIGHDNQFFGRKTNQSATKLTLTSAPGMAITPGCAQGLRCSFLGDEPQLLSIGLWLLKNSLRGVSDEN